MPDAHSVLLAEIQAEYGARDDMRIWPNVSSKVWVGKYIGRTGGGDVVLRGARQIKAGLCVGSSDLVGIAPGGRFLALEGKTGKAVATKKQKRFIEVVNDLGAIAAVVRSTEDVAKLLRL